MARGVVVREAYELKIDASNHQGACREHVGLCLLEREEYLLFMPETRGEPPQLLTPTNGLWVWGSQLTEQGSLPDLEGPPKATPVRGGTGPG